MIFAPRPFLAVLALQVLVCLKCVSSDNTMSSEGTSFALAIYGSDSNSWETEIAITTRAATRGKIIYPTSTEDLNLPLEHTFRHLVGDSSRVLSGIETKAIYVETDEPVTVHVASTRASGQCNPDASLVRPLGGGNNTYYFVASSDKTETSSWDRRPLSFYMVVATENNTYVEVYRKSGANFTLDMSETLQRHQVYTRDSTSDLTGAYVISSKPVSVYSGHGHVDMSPIVVSICLHVQYQLC